MPADLHSYSGGALPLSPRRTYAAVAQLEVLARKAECRFESGQRLRSKGHGAPPALRDRMGHAQNHVRQVYKDNPPAGVPFLELHTPLKTALETLKYTVSQSEGV